MCTKFCPLHLNLTQVIFAQPLQMQCFLNARAPPQKKTCQACKLNSLRFFFNPKKGLPTVFRRKRIQSAIDKLRMFQRSCARQRIRTDSHKFDLQFFWGNRAPDNFRTVTKLPISSGNSLGLPPSIWISDFELRVWDFVVSILYLMISDFRLGLWILMFLDFGGKTLYLDPR